ncbi:RNA polymerase sigma-70 factor [Nocardia asteroides]|uniref:RNA polymerase ECF-type sigma factor n=1 Tax=Nocardia asteroides NBRC 15531 TaxID=1110697 RepID=U5EGP5_NOCAS|nr:RNA polymerase sigma-70 factor [Nocardia asteroides]TLF70058.1 RNA polymerase sigma-70 factor [Nocardia asteroides NBRC 15531]UGT49583.1 RNA polymerase sigma-70 factor [Nocardia asteroides]SFL95263.1 RNA polymerase, sigma-24 subunit, RpoE [Nocardia asteroides]VEG37757.1 RNA polymerase sigma factor SigJ [Nocardia asteroides]GAD84329.1 putative RNA polymerase ECF-type sigma factor [Nocardia asteroides NBRC 15531]
MTGTPDPADEFAEHRRLLFSIAYEILGSVADTEDVLHDSYLRWREVDPATVDNPRAYLARIVTRQALSVLRSAARRREEYIGPWLPEPLAAESPDGVEHVLTGEAVTTAMLLVLETLTPIQRAVFVLREVFAFSYAEIGAAVDKSEAAVRQVNQRARERVHAKRHTAVATPSEAQSVAERFSIAAATGDVQALMDVLAPDVVYIGDGGGVVNAVRRPVLGPDKVARLVVGLFQKGSRMGAIGVHTGVYNAMPSVAVTIDGVLDQVTSVEVTDGVVTAVYCVRNPEKLRGVRIPG